MKAVGIIILCLMIWSGSGQCQEPAVVSYKQYLNEVLEYYPSLKKQSANIEKALAERALAASSRMPQFWASADFQYGNDPVYVFGALLRQNKFNADDFALGRLNEPKSYANQSGSIQGQWLLFDFGQTASRLKRAGLLVDSAHYQADMTKMEAILAAFEVYSRLAMAQALISQFDLVTTEGTADVAFAENLEKKGLRLGADFYLARMTASKLLQNMNEIKAQEAALTMVFNILRGKDPAMPVRVALDFESEVPLNGSVEEWISRTLNHRLDLKAMAMELQAQGVESNREKKSFLPQISAYGQATDNVHGLNQSGGNDYGIGLKATMPIFDPGFLPRVKKAKAETDYLSNQYQETKDQAARDTAEIYYQIQALKSNRALALKVLMDARRAAALTSSLYKEGRRSVEEILSIRAGLLEAYEHWIRLENAYRQNILSLRLYAGELDPKVAVEIYEAR